nr:MAG TPA: hypothetical protein [Caudoviricetes sp.]
MKNIFCPFTKHECMECCGMYSMDFEACSLLLIGKSMKEISFTADNVNTDCAIRVCEINSDPEEKTHGD